MPGIRVIKSMRAERGVCGVFDLGQVIPQQPLGIEKGVGAIGLGIP